MSYARLRRDQRRARGGVVGAIVVLVVAMSSAGALIGRSQDQQRHTLDVRFDSRQATAARFIEAYVAETLEHERVHAGRAFAGPTTGEAFATKATEMGYAAAVLLDSTGHLIASQPLSESAVGKDLTVDYVHLRTAVGGTPAVSGVIRSAVKGELVVGFAVPFDTPQGRRVFSGASAVEATPLAAFVQDATPFATAHVMIVDDAGVVVAGNSAGSFGRRLADISPELASVTTPTGFVQEESKTAYVTQSPVHGTPWRLVFAVHTDELYAPLGGAGHWLPWAALATVGLLCLLSLALFYRYTFERVRMAQRDARHRTILDTASDALIGVDASGNISEWNAAAVRMLGWTAAEARGRRLEGLVATSAEPAADVPSLAGLFAASKSAFPDGPVQLVVFRRDGDPVDVEVTLSRLQWGPDWYLHAFLRDISERLSHERQLREFALTDSLTGLANRRAALDRLEQALARAERHGNPVALIYIDIDDFKRINDDHGHSAGDAILMEVGVRLRTTFRTEDTIARLGGDEFLVVCEDLRLPGDAKALVDRTRVALARPYVHGGQTLRVSASVGLGVSDAATTVERLIDYADADMYEAKAAKEAFAAAADR